MKSNKPDGVNPSMALWFAVVYQWRRVADLERSAIRCVPAVLEHVSKLILEMRRVMKSLVFGLLWVSTAAGHAVDLPVTLYEMDFSVPEVGSYSIWYGSPPAVWSSVPPFENALFFDAVGGMEQIALPINVVAPRYEIQYDVLVHNLHDSLHSFTVLLDTPSVRTVTFHPRFDSIDMYNLGRLIPFSNDTVYHFNMVVDFREDLWALTVNDSAHFSTTFGASALRSIRFSFGEWRSGAPDEPQTYAALDNVLITAIPEPTTFTMLGLGSLVLMFGRFRAPRSLDVMKERFERAGPPASLSPVVANLKPMKTFIVFVYSCAGVLASDGTIQVVTTSATNAERAILVTRETFTRDGKTNLVRDTLTKDGTFHIQLHRFHHQGQILGDFVGKTNWSAFGNRPGTTYSMALEFDASGKVKLAVIYSQGTVLDAFYHTNGIFSPVESSVITNLNLIRQSSQKAPLEVLSDSGDQK